MQLLVLAGLWDSSDTFYYDKLHVVSPQCTVSLRIRSLVGLTPLIAVHVIRQSELCSLPRLAMQLKKSIDATLQLQVSRFLSLSADVDWVGIWHNFVLLFCYLLTIMSGSVCAIDLLY